MALTKATPIEKAVQRNVKDLGEILWAAHMSHNTSAINSIRHLMEKLERGEDCRALEDCQRYDMYLC